MNIYRILGWDDHFENNKSRERESCSFVCVPNKQDGLSFNRLMTEKDGAAIFGVWILLLEIASRQGKHRSGWLTEDGHPTGTALAPSDIAMLVRRPESEIVRALEFLCSPKIGWLGVTDVIGDQQPALPGTPAPAKSPPTVVAVPLADADWLKEIASSPAYSGINIPVEFEKMRLWCCQNKRITSRKRFINWLNRVERPMTAGAARAPVADKKPWQLEAESLIQVMRNNPAQIHDFEPARNIILAGGREAVNWLNSTLTQDERAWLLREFNCNHKWEIIP